MTDQIFADALGPIVVVGGTVRVDFVTLIPDLAEAGGRPKPVVVSRLIMPTEAFLTAARRFAEASDTISHLDHGGAPAPAHSAAPPEATAAAAPPATGQPVVTAPAPVKPPFP
jgi:hypothetical protein